MPTIVGTDADDSRVGEGGAQDSISGLGGNDTLSGADGADSLDGGAGNDSLIGGAGDDTLQGGRGGDTIDGGPGVDTLAYENPTSGLFVNLETGTAVSSDTAEGEDRLSGLENVTGGRFNDVMTGDGAANRLVGLEGSDSLLGGGGTDTLEGGAGDDTLSGGDGSDWLFGGAGAELMLGGAAQDIFELRAGDSPMLGLLTERDRISGLGVDDLLLFRGGVTPTAENYIELNAGLTDPRAIAQEMAGRGYEYIAVQIGGSVEFFAPRLDVGVTLINASIDGLSLANLAVQPPSASPTPTAGDDLIAGAGNDTIDGLAGQDTISETSGTNYLRGGEGNDSIVGGSGFDDINGNMGADTCVSGGGDDWVVGGRDGDSLSGSAGANLVYGNLGNDTCEGGDGNDIIRGGQDNDVVRGGGGDDFVSGDKGDDTMSGGAGADSFHTFGDAGVDRVLDFSLAEGDRVQLDPGTQFTVAQVGGDTVISMTGGGQMTLVGVSMSTLTPGWIFGA